MESDGWVVQCKLLQNCSLQALTELVEETHALAQAKGKRGMVCIKVRRGKGKPSPILCVLTSEQWRSVNEEASA